MRIRDPGWRQFGSGIWDGDSSDPGSGMEKVGSGIRDKHPGSATLFIWFTGSMQIFLSDCNHFWQGKFGCIFCVTHFRFTPLAPWAIRILGNHVHLSTWAALRASTTRSQQPCCSLEFPWRPLTLYWCCWRSPPTTTQRLTGTDQGLSSAGTWNRVVKPEFNGES